ncbi:MAG: exodeoxyribonuclease VII large subunit, partial [Dethiobacteria bacterium]|nr:exodeoxyribonuclease VII large subunit [Dethiobacteria bacterium]
VIIHGSISVYEPDGLYQLYVAEMEPAGMGSLFLAFEQLKQKLEAEGLFRNEYKKPLPLLPKKIALITSPSGAALQDILATFRSRFPHVHLLVVESLVQGAGAAVDIVRALELINKRSDLDLVIMTRGGGSLEDLWPFNEESVARAIFNSRLPVISAIGHETDFTIADFTADLRAPTPTAAAVSAVPDLGDMLLTLNRLSERAAMALQSRLQLEKQQLDHVVSERFFRLPELRIRYSREQLQQIENKLQREIVQLLQFKGLKLGAQIDKLESFSPLKVMNRGYSYCRDEEGNIVRSVKDIAVGRVLQLSFKDGQARCRTEEIEEEVTVEG